MLHAAAYWLPFVAACLGLHDIKSKAKQNKWKTEQQPKKLHAGYAKYSTTTEAKTMFLIHC